MSRSDRALVAILLFVLMLAVGAASYYAAWQHAGGALAACLVVSTLLGIVNGVVRRT